MQLTHVFARAGKVIWLLVLLPLLAAGGTVAYMADQEPAVHTLATVSVVAPEGQSTAATVTQAVDGFTSAVVSENVVRLAEQDAGIRVAVDRDLRAERVGTSNLVELRIATEHGDKPAQLVHSLVKHTTEALFASSLASASSRLRNAEKRYDEAIQERDAQLRETGLMLPIESYRAKASEVTQLRVALVTSVGTGVDLPFVRKTLKRANTELEQIGEYVTEYETVQDRVQRTRNDVAEATQERDELLTRQEAAMAAESVSVSDPEPESRRTLLFRSGVTGLVAGLGVAVGLVLLIGLLRGPRTPRTGS